ncbi:hypothetical protein J3454_14390 [Erythrobacter sp. NFXS35]|uniref:hypothetical protein n=1 Tax=Erythrobacter sp. NFXS35 TaxID=2818436 RepID=UPI0032DFA07D
MQDHVWYRPGEKKPDPKKKGKAASSSEAVGEQKGPGFRIRMASLIERGEFDAELDGRHSAASVPNFVMLETAIAGVGALLEGDEAEEITQLLRSFHSEAGAKDDGGERAGASATERAQIAQVEDVLKKSWPAYRQLIEQSARYRNLMPLLAFQRFVDGFENVTGTDGKLVEFERDANGQIPDTVLRRIHPALLYAVGNRAYSFQYSVGEEKN